MWNVHSRLEYGRNVDCLWQTRCKLLSEHLASTGIFLNSDTTCETPWFNRVIIKIKIHQITCCSVTSIDSSKLSLQHNNLCDIFTSCPFPPTGQVTIPGEITFQLDTDPATDPPMFTLTCTSTGGPATTVSWRRNDVVLTDNSYYSIVPQILLDSETATYTHTLTVTGRLVGEYQCIVSNIRTPSGSSRSLTVVGKECNVACLWGVMHVKSIM